MSKAIKPKDKFEHARQIVGSPADGTARPMVCKVTKVARGVVWYQNETGMKMRASVGRLQENVGRWLTGSMAEQ